MATTSQKPRLIALVGPTASGKSELAMRLAQAVPAEIIAADSRTIYKNMDIGTAKPSKTDRSLVPHWGLDLTTLGKNFSALEFQGYARRKIEQIKARHRLALLVGGTGLYVDSVLYDYEFPEQGSGERLILESKTIEDLQALITTRGFQMPVNKNNPRHLIRTIERQGSQGHKSCLRSDALIIGLQPPDEILKEKISKRAEMIFKSGVIDETRTLVDKYGQAAVARNGGIAYRLCIRIMNGEITEQTAITLFKTADWRYARRQKTWYKKNNDIIWFTDIKQAYKYLINNLNT